MPHQELKYNFLLKIGLNFGLKFEDSRGPDRRNGHVIALGTKPV